MIQVTTHLRNTKADPKIFNTTECILKTTTRRPIRTTIRLGAVHNEVRCVDPRGVDAPVVIPLTGMRHHDRHTLAKTLCELHGIGTRKQWGKFHKAEKQEAAKWKAKRLARKAANTNSTQAAA